MKIYPNIGSRLYDVYFKKEHKLVMRNFSKQELIEKKIWKHPDFEIEGKNVIPHIIKNNIRLTFGL